MLTYAYTGLKRDGWRTFYWRRFVSVGVPYLCWNLIYFLWFPYVLHDASYTATPALALAHFGHLLEVGESDLEWDVDRFRVKGNPERFKTMTELAWAAYHEVPPGMEPGLEATHFFEPSNFTFPFGAHVISCEVDAL